MKRGERIPDDHIWCSKCKNPYGIIRCRVTYHNPLRNICLTCAAEECVERENRKKEQDAAKLSTVKNP